MSVSLPNELSTEHFPPGEHLSKMSVPWSTGYTVWVCCLLLSSFFTHTDAIPIDISESSSLHVLSYNPACSPRLTNVSDSLRGSEFDVARLLPRTTSQDPSCPAGYLCILEACPANVNCAAGETCLNFEGTIACSSASLDWCALNPSTFEAVGCNGGQCWSVSAFAYPSSSTFPRM